MKTSKRPRLTFWVGLGVSFGSLGLDLGSIRGSISRVRGLIGRGLGVNLGSSGLHWERFGGRFGQFWA